MLTQQKLVPLGDVLDKYVVTEAKSMALANTTITKSKDFLRTLSSLI